MTLDTLPPMRSLGPLEISRAPLAGHPAYAALLGAARRTGRCPVWISEPDALLVPDDIREVVATVDATDPADFLARHWTPNCPLCGCRDPFGDIFPGLARPTPTRLDPYELAAAAVESRPAAHLAVVPVTRPADTVAAVGWTGPCNYGTDLAGLCAVLRSWEDRFGAVVVAMDRSVLWLSVAAPPTTPALCRAVAAEHFAFCRDVDWEDPRPLRVYASTLRGTSTWRFWWD